MPPAKRGRKSNAASSTSMMKLTHDDDASTSQMSQTMTQTQSGKFTEEELEAKGNDMVRFFLATTSKKNPIKRSEINEKILKGGMSRSFNQVMEYARKQMSEIFGMDIVEVEKSKSYCVVNRIDAHPSREDGQDKEFLKEDKDYQQSALLMIVLAIIFMEGDSTSEDTVWAALRTLGLKTDGGVSQPFGDVKKVVTTEFVQQGFLKYTKLMDTDPVKHEFTWGPRAEHMTTREDVLSFVCQIYNGMRTFDWTQQYDSIHGEGAAAEARDEARNLTQPNMTQV